jgi:hypothetical protein
MLDDYFYQQQKRRRARRWDLRVPIGTVLCGLALTYLLTAALIGLLAS